MKGFIALFFMMSVSSSALELSATFENTNCHITANGLVTTTRTYGQKEEKISLTETKSISHNGINKIIDNVIEEASQDPNDHVDDNYVFRIHKEAKTYFIGPETKNKNALNLIRLIVQACK